MKKTTNVKIADINENVLEIIDIIKGSNYEVLIVGGFIRDYLLNIKSNDYDLVVSAPLECIEALFFDVEYIYYRGLKTTLKVNYKGVSVEVSSYRKEIYGNDFSSLKYIKANTFKEDTQRRDFSINALAYDVYTNQLYDYCNGLKDINDKIIRSINDPNIRFKEDHSRILRALRLSSTKNLVIEDKTKTAILNNYKKTLNLKTFNKEIKLIMSGSNFNYVYDNFKEIFAYISNNKFTNTNIEDRTILKNDLNLINYLYFVLDLKFDNNIYKCLKFSKKHKDFILNNENIINKLKEKLDNKQLNIIYINHHNEINQILKIFNKFNYLNKDNIKELSNQSNFINLSDLKINENDINLALKNDIYLKLNEILIKVINNELKNDRKTLLKYINKN